MSGKTVLVTGATDGLGRALVLLHGRDPERIRQTGAKRHHHTGSERCAAIGRTSPRCARDGREMRARKQRLDILVNDVGIGNDRRGGEQRMTSQDGHELRFTVNYLAGYPLTHQLLDLLKAAAPARIVNISSAVHMPPGRQRRHARARLQRRVHPLPVQAGPDPFYLHPR